LFRLDCRVDDGVPLSRNAIVTGSSTFVSLKYFSPAAPSVIKIATAQ
jgi:hypothetical protein